MVEFNVLQKRRIYDDFLRDDPTPRDFEVWCVVTAEKYGTTFGRVRNIIAEYAELEDLTMRKATVSEARKLASLAGATLSEAYKTLARGMKASTKKVVTNKEGAVVDVIKHPDYATQVRAATEVLKSQGAYEPQKIDVNLPNDPTKLSNDQLLAEIRNLSQQIVGAPEGAEGAAGGTEPAVLPDELHADEGRAGSGEPVQAVPAA